MYKKILFIIIGVIFLFSSSGVNLYSLDRGNFGNITLDLKNVDILDVLKIFSMHSNLSIVAGQDVKARVTIFLKDVNAWDAFEVILAANNLAYKEEGGIIKVLTTRNYLTQYGRPFYEKTITKSISLKNARAEDVSNALNQIRSEFGKVIVDQRSNTVIIKDTPEMIQKMEKVIKSIEVSPETKVFTLKYADVEEMTEKIKENLTEGIGSVEIDKRTGKIVVTDIPPKIEQVTKMLDSFDEKSREVLIKAKIVEVSLNPVYRLGIDWASIFSQHTLGVNVEHGDLVYYTGVDDDGFDLVMDAFKTMGKIRVISQPKILALNHKEASIKITERQPYVTTNVSAVGESTQVGESITFMDIGTQMTVIPTINPDGYITMEVKPKISSAPTDFTYTSSYGGVSRSIPIERTSEAEATVMVKDGKTIVIGGLMRERIDESRKRVPVLSNIPILGGLFRHKSTETKNVELAIFLTPEIITGDKSTEVEELKKKGEIESTVSAEEKPTFSWLKKGKKNAYTDYYLSLSGLLSKYIAENYSPARKGGRVNIVITLDSDGNLINEPNITRAPDKKLGLIAKTLVTQAAPFPSFPDDLQKRQEAFRVSVNLPSTEGDFPVLEEKEMKSLYGFSSKEKIFSDYYLTLSENISNYMMKNYPSTKGKKIEISFELSENGKLVGRPNVIGKINPQLRELTIRAMRELSPFQPFPKEFEKASKNFRILINIPKRKISKNLKTTYQPESQGSEIPYQEKNIKKQDKTSDLSYEEYKRYISRKISGVIKSPPGIKGEVKVKFRVNKDGTLIKMPVIISSSDKKLSKAITDAVNKSAPFPQLPQAVSKNKAVFEISIVFE